jgi:hypothetical protein
MQQQQVGSVCIYKPVKYSKDPGTGQPIYTFPIEYTGSDIIIDSDSHPVLDVLQSYLSHDNTIDKLMTELIDVNRTMFAKKYTAQQLLKITTHAIQSADDNHGTMWKCIPTSVTLTSNVGSNGNKFIIYWSCVSMEPPPPMIDLGDIISRPSSPGLDDVTELLKPEESSENPISLRSPTDIRKERERQRIYEARLRAKMAVFRAEKVVQKYIDRYGADDLSDNLSDSGDSSDGSDNYSELSR